ncbi:uncharacterized protein LOC128883378 [Hylaeus volcanicus]|uniref:uncharacterized protein LOC128883378 n=1 Tax=Hylaeus volcanicus TaxID=313075 RepID=UPI0023B777A5|nr:uncharacterized protein LOC128883378 [Hylaeus volcanicus]
MAYVNENQFNLADMYAQEVHERLKQKNIPMDGSPQYPHYTHDPVVLEEDNSTRGEAWSDLLSCLTSPLLRLGLLIQLLVLIFGFALYYGHGGTGVFTFDLFNTPEKLRTSQGYSAILIVLQFFFLLGCMCISSFQIYVADNSKLTRGFRAGSKMLSTATLLDTFVVGLRLMQSIYAYQFLGKRWWMKYTQSNADWCLFFSGTLLHSVALALYALAFFYMEAYHDEGTYEEWSWILLSLFSLAAFFEFLLIFTGFGNFFSLIHIAALATAVFWAFSFEPLLHYYSPVFHDRDINADIPTEDIDDNQLLNKEMESQPRDSYAYTTAT